MKYPKKVINYIEEWLKSYAKKNKINGFVVGISGGIDSALTSTLCAKTKLPVLCLEMNIYQEKKQVSRALNHINWLKKNFNNISSKSLNLSNTFEAFKSDISSKGEKNLEFLSFANSRSRLRMMTLYHYATINNFLVAGTGNKVEDFGIGFYTKYGDGGVDISPIADLLKSEVYALSKTIGVIDEIQKAEPTDGLWSDNRSDEEQIGASYNELEWAMKYQNSNKIKALTKRDKEVLSIYEKLNSKNSHKMSPIPICQIPNTLR